MSEQIREGMKFNSLGEWDKFRKKYQNEHNVLFTRGRSDKLSSMTFIDPVNEDVEYYRVQYKCKSGGNYESKSTGERKTR